MRLNKITEVLSNDSAQNTEYKNEHTTLPN